MAEVWCWLPNFQINFPPPMVKEALPYASWFTDDE